MQQVQVFLQVSEHTIMRTKLRCIQFLRLPLDSVELRDLLLVEAAETALGAEHEALDVEGVLALQEGVAQAFADRDDGLLFLLILIALGGKK